MWYLVISVMIQYQINLDVVKTSERETSYNTNEAACKAAALDPRNNKLLTIWDPGQIAAHWEVARCVKK